MPFSKPSLETISSEELESSQGHGRSDLIGPGSVPTPAPSTSGTSAPCVATSNIPVPGPSRNISRSPAAARRGVIEIDGGRRVQAPVTPSGSAPTLQHQASSSAGCLAASSNRGGATGYSLIDFLQMEQEDPPSRLAENITEKYLQIHGLESAHPIVPTVLSLVAQQFISEVIKEAVAHKFTTAGAQGDETLTSEDVHRFINRVRKRKRTNL